MTKPFVIDNNNYKDRKTISLFKRFPFINGISNKRMEFTARINNVKEGRIFYSMVDTPHSTYNGEISIQALRGIILRKYKKGTNQLLETVTVLNGSTVARQTTVKKLAGSFYSETPIDVEVEVQLSSGYMRALLDVIQKRRDSYSFRHMCLFLWWFFFSSTSTNSLHKHI